jgi:hypothetical protein
MLSRTAIAGWFQAVRYAGRSIRRSPGFALVAALTLGPGQQVFAGPDQVSVGNRRSCRKVDPMIALRSE